MTARRLLAGLALLAALFLALLAALGLGRVPGGALDEAKSRWARRPFAHYRLLVAEDHNRCQHDAEVRGEAMVAVRNNPCGLPNRTVDDLFAAIADAESTIYPCVAYGCACETVVTVRGRYSTAMGFPLEIGREWVVRFNWHHPDFWRYVWSTGSVPGCQKATFIKTVDVLRMTPLP